MRQSRAPGARRSPPLPRPASPLQLGLVGRDAPPADAGCPAGRPAPRPPLQLGASAAHRLPGSLPETRGPRGGTYGAPPPARFPRGPRSFRTCESGRSAAQKMDAGGWARTPVPPPVQAGGRPDLAQAPGALPAARLGAPAPPLRSHPAGRGHPAQRRPRAPTRVLCSSTPHRILRDKVSPVLSHGCQGRPRSFPNMV